jgi:hypothetical protein
VQVVETSVKAREWGRPGMRSEALSGSPRQIRFNFLLIRGSQAAYAVMKTVKPKRVHVCPECSLK